MEDRAAYSQRIMQRLAINVSRYSILNIHRIGINAPVHHVFEELLQWDGDSTCWPNHLASVERIDGRLDRIRIYLLGIRAYPRVMRNGIWGFRFVPLFNLTGRRFHYGPLTPSDVDNARYLLYQCGGGYPIGMFATYVRSAIAAEGERERTQFFIAVGFNFYGRKKVRESHLAGRLWELIHNRVTANVMNRFKTLCEWRFERLQRGDTHPSLGSTGGQGPGP